jgi:hypothetical protein
MKMILKPNHPQGLIRIGALWTWERLSPAGQVIEVQRAHNLAPVAGRNKLLDILFHGATSVNPWYILLFNSDHTPTDADTYAVPGFTEFTDYAEANRQEFFEGAAVGGVSSNSGSRAVFTMSAENTIYGSALVGGGTDPSTKGDIAGGGTLISSVKMGAPGLYTAGEIVRVTVNITLAAG